LLFSTFFHDCGEIIFEVDGKAEIDVRPNTSEGETRYKNAGLAGLFSGV